MDTDKQTSPRGRKEHRRPQFSLGYLLGTISLFAVSFALIRSASVCAYDPYVILYGYSGIGLFGASIGGPLGYLIRGRRGALTGALFGALIVLSSVIIVAMVIILGDL